MRWFVLLYAVGMSSLHTESKKEGNAPQAVINEFWDNLISKKPGKVTKIFPSSLYANLLPHTIVKGRNAAESYEAAAKECRAKVARIVQECERTNEKFTDSEFDLTSRPDNCLNGLLEWYDDPDTDPGANEISPIRLGYALRTLLQAGVLTGDVAPVSLRNAANILMSRPVEVSSGPGSVHRIDWIFEKPQFEIENFTSSDVVQGSNGDCWFIAAVATICSSQELIKRVFVAKDEHCGVYGFVFHRDGEWISTVVDDNLCLKKSDFDAKGDLYDPTGTKETRYRKSKQTGSEALYFASCSDENETWLPLLEKAYAKVHGDYEAISGGIPGEAVEDLTGGVTSKILTDRIFDKDRLWEELKQANHGFLFSAASPGSYGDDSDSRRGLALNHAYSIIRARDAESEDGKIVHRLVLVRNPWGKRLTAGMGEWNGPWSDGSSEWNPYWFNKLEHTFGDDGLFWISYEDLLRRFDLLDRTRVFDSTWTVVQSWTSVSVAWVTGYMNTKFSVEIKKKGPVVFQLCQLDDRYFRGLRGKYRFDLHFILQERDAAPGDYIVRARGAWFGNRSISAEIDLELGIYEVVPKIEARHDPDVPDVHEVVTKLAERNPQKLRQIGVNYDLANARGLAELTEEELEQEQDKKRKAAEKKKKAQEAAEKERADFEAWKKDKDEFEAWKRMKKQSEEKGTSAKTSTETPAAEEAKEQVTAAEDPANTVRNTDNSAPPKDSEPGAIEASKAETLPETKDMSTNTSPRADGAGANSELQAEQMPRDDPERPSPRGRPLPAHAYRDAPLLYGEEPSPEAGPRARSPDDTKSRPWNAVCVLGLRVHSQDAEVTIKLIKPKNAEEGAILDVGGDTAAGATM
ncbi:hypothetical protein E8E13_002914 [Curvularia kusanoi]|uniref:Calpain catalytic domain-containing protein n=1 Tax=Curvularia kusanoi TaxID=90978 RepID=A0A9P4T8B7_CURKU|nr:hypothetical protein E8E13_002914 [Curvularia kusanoi]